MPTIAEVKEQIRDRSVKALTLVEDDKLTMAEKKTQLDVLEPEIKDLTEQLKDMEHLEEARAKYAPFTDPDAGGDGGKKSADGTKPAVAKSVGQQFIESDGYKALMRAGLKGGRWSSGEIELKALGEGTDDTAPGNALIATPTVLPGIVDIRLMELTVADLFPAGVAQSPLIRYLVETVITNAAAAVAELGDKPLSSIEFGKVDETLHKIATFLQVSDEMLEDYDQIRSYLNARLELFVKHSEEAQLLSGDGRGANLVGLLNRDGLARAIVKGTLPSTRDDNDMDAIYRQITAIRVTAFLEPDAIVIDPLGWQNIALTKSAQGIYYAGGPFMPAGPPSLWGKRVVATPRMPSLSALVGAFALGGQVFRKGGITVEASNSHEDNFRRNQTAIRAEERLALAVYRPGAFGVVSNL